MGLATKSENEAKEQEYINTIGQVTEAEYYSKIDELFQIDSGKGVHDGYSYEEFMKALKAR